METIVEVLTSGDVMDNIVKFAGVIGSVVLAYVNNQKSAKIKEVQSINDRLKDNIYQAKIQKVKELYDLQHFSLMERTIQQLFLTTPIDRFTIMFVMNGKIDFNYLTVIFDQSSTDLELGGVSPYARFPIDHEYRRMLKEMEVNKFVWRKSPEFRVGRINDFLEMEKVNNICWAYVTRIALDEFNDLVVFLSVSSVGPEISRVDKNIVELLISGKILPELIPAITLPTMEKDADLLDHIKQ